MKLVVRNRVGGYMLGHLARIVAVSWFVFTVFVFGGCGGSNTNAPKVVVPGDTLEVSVQLQIRIDLFEDPNGLFGDEFAVGGILNCTFAFDRRTKDQNFHAHTGSYVHRPSPYGFSIQHGGLIIASNPEKSPLSVLVENGVPIDRITFESKNNLPLSQDITDVDSWIEWILSTDGDPLPNDELPTLIPSLDVWSVNDFAFYGRSTISGYQFRLEGTVVSMESM